MEKISLLNFGQPQQPVDIESQRSTTNPSETAGVNWRGRNIQDLSDSDYEIEPAIICLFSKSCLSVAALGLVTFVMGGLAFTNSTNDERGNIFSVVGLMALCGSAIFCCAIAKYQTISE